MHQFYQLSWACTCTIYFIIKEKASTLSSQHRLLSDLYERLNDLGPGVVRIRKDRKKIKELQDELARQVSLIKDRPFNEVPKKMQLVTDAIQMLLKYPTGISSVTETTDADAPKKVNTWFLVRVPFCRKILLSRFLLTVCWTCWFVTYSKFSKIFRKN